MGFRCPHSRRRKVSMEGSPSAVHHKGLMASMPLWKRLSSVSRKCDFFKSSVCTVCTNSRADSLQTGLA
eukprot:Skav210366  [mRNA]  locus=scaffold1357:189539:196078:+ [translate_table: standard]